ncbi:MAG: DUF1295 domain-containing protein, partial [Flavobacteriales bacterium]|nr:DUF1295 domain-containing protein [Flavobacteriales bacterium]
MADVDKFPAIYLILDHDWIIYISLSQSHFYFPFKIAYDREKNAITDFSDGSHFQFSQWFADYPENWVYDYRFIIGIVLFVIGVAVNWYSDTRLIHLRKPGETGYVIPQGWLFKYISCPNLFGEVIEWLGYAILTWSLAGTVFFIWTFANLV